MTSRYTESVNNYLANGTRDAIRIEYAKLKEILDPTKKVVSDIDILCSKLDTNLCDVQDSLNASNLEKIKKYIYTALRSIALLHNTARDTVFVMPEIQEKAEKAKESTKMLYSNMHTLQKNIFHLKPNTNKTEICTISTDIKMIANRVTDDWNTVLEKVKEIKKRDPKEFEVGTTGPNPFGSISTRRERYNPRPGGGSRHRRKRTRRNRKHRRTHRR